MKMDFAERCTWDSFEIIFSFLFVDLFDNMGTWWAFASRPGS